MCTTQRSCRCRITVCQFQLTQGEFLPTKFVGSSVPRRNTSRTQRRDDKGLLWQHDCRLGHEGKPSSFGEMTEWPIVQHWKCCVPQGTGGSNPPLSAQPEASESSPMAQRFLRFTVSRNSGEVTKIPADWIGPLDRQRSRSGIKQVSSHVATRSRSRLQGAG